VVGALAFGFMASVRPQVFTFFLFSAWLYLLERARDGDWRLTWLIPLSGLVWPNLHGGFLAGLGVIVLFGVGELLQRRSPLRFALLAATTGLASLATPYGFTYWTYLVGAIRMDRATIREWQSWDLVGSELPLFGFRVLLVLTSIALCARAVRRQLPDPATVLVLVVTAALGIRVLKHVTLFVIASAPFVCVWTSGPSERMAALLGLDRRRMLRITAAAFAWLGRGLALGATVLVLATVPMRIVLFDAFPVRAVDFIAQNRLQGNLLVPFNFGGYALWRLYPACRVAMDSRYDAIYLEATFDEVRGFFGGERGWSEFLDRYPHDIILGPRRGRLEANLAGRSDWAVAYEDQRHRVYVRSALQRDWPPLAPVREEDPCSTAGKPRYVP
jgi:hypothetical protein